MSVEASFAELDSLVALITKSVNDVKEEYKRLNHSFPSLDDPKPHPLDSQYIPPNLKNAVRTIQGACSQLTALVAPPEYTVIVKALEYNFTTFARTAQECKIADLLKEHPEGMHVSEIATQTGLHPIKLSHILRALATKHVFREVKNDVYANNRLSMSLASDNPASFTVSVIAEEVVRAAVYLHETLLDPVFGHSDKSNETSMVKFYNKTFWELLAAEPARVQRFGMCMGGFAILENSECMAAGYPWKEQPVGTTVCDVGGGIGFFSLQLARIVPNINIILQDLEGTVNQAVEHWKENALDLVDAQRVSFVPVDFFKESPAPNCDYYYLKHIIHDWPDAESITILSNVRKVMKPTSRLIIQESLLRSAARDTNEDDALDSMPKAPAPLLPNYGDGGMFPHLIDMAMLVLSNSKERTISEYKALGQAAGLELMKVWDCGDVSALEFKLAAKA